MSREDSKAMEPSPLRGVGRPNLHALAVPSGSRTRLYPTTRADVGLPSLPLVKAVVLMSFPSTGEDSVLSRLAWAPMSLVAEGDVRTPSAWGRREPQWGLGARIACRDAAATAAGWLRLACPTGCVQPFQSWAQRMRNMTGAK